MPTRIHSSIKNAVAGAAVMLALAGCVTIGTEFPLSAVDSIKPGTTTLDDIRKLLGNPVRTGSDDGKVTWTYLRYHANLAGDFDGKDLVVKFDNQNKVVSFSYNSTDVARPVTK